MPSYLEKEQIHQVVPYIANASAILNTFNTKVQYWAAGAARVKTAYDQYLGMDLTRESNQMNLRNFMTEANEKLKQAAHTDLSIGDNQEAALNIFDPLTNGETTFSKNILGDNAVTRHYKNELAVAQSYRTKENGKYYYSDNERHLRNQIEDFRKESNDDAWQKYYAGKQFYTPYHDYKSEIRELMDKFKPSTTDIQVPQKGSLYLHEVKNADYTKAEVRRYLEANLSDKAKEQMKIESAVAFHDRPDALITAVGNQWNQELAKYKSYDTSLEARIRLEKDPAAKAQLVAEQEGTRQRIASLNTGLSKYNNKDYTDILNNKDAYAFQLYYDNEMDGTSTGYVRIDKTEKYIPDQAAISQMNETGRNMRTALIIQSQKDIAHENNETRIRVAEINAAGKLANPIPGVPMPGDPQVPITITDKDYTPSEISRQSLEKDIEAQNKIQQGSYLTIFDKLHSQGKVKDADSDELKMQVAKEYLQKIQKKYDDYSRVFTNPAEVRTLMEQDFFPGVTDVMNSIGNSNRMIYAANATKERLIKDTNKELTDLYNEGKLRVRYNDKNGHSKDLVVDPKTLSKFAMGDRSVIQEKEVMVYPSEQEMGSSHGYARPRKETKFYYNGRELLPVDVGNLLSTFDKAVNKKFGKENAKSQIIWGFGAKGKSRLDQATTEVLNTVTHMDKELKAGDFQVLGNDLDGNIYFKADNRIKGGIRVTSGAEADGRYLYKIQSQSFKTDADAILPSFAKPLKYFLEQQIPFLEVGRTVSTPADKSFFQYGDTPFRVEATKNPDMTVNLYLYDMNRDMSIGTFTDPYTVARAAEQYYITTHQGKSK